MTEQTFFQVIARRKFLLPSRISLKKNLKVWGYLINNAHPNGKKIIYIYYFYDFFRFQSILIIFKLKQ